ncbi:MAG: hypothetical protein ACKPEQ_40505, partial [Dolichospermum sp.]
VKDKNKSVTKMVTVDRKLRDITVLEEAGIYQLIFSSRLTGKYQLPKNSKTGYLKKYYQVSGKPDLIQHPRKN